MAPLLRLRMFNHQFPEFLYTEAEFLMEVLKLEPML
jgi:hypothetical protein